MNWNKSLLLIIICLLLVIDFLTFHDIFEPHTIKDWLILGTSIVTFVYFARTSLKKATV